MPELPEVETIRRGFESRLAPPGRRILDVELKRRDLRAPIPKNLPARLRGATITGYRRWGKYLLWDTTRESLLCHLGMTGTWRDAPAGDERDHDHVYVHLEGGTRLAFRDPRRFGFLDVVAAGREREHASLRDLGPDALDKASFHLAHLKSTLLGRKAPVKALLLDQRVVAGVGNIYAAEALFRAGIRPLTPAGRIGPRRLAALLDAVRSVLADAIESGGSTLRDYRGTGGELGSFQHRFEVYAREGQPCTRCERPLRGAIVGGRSTVWCSRCQR